MPNEGQFVLEADLVTNTLTLTAERTISAETNSRLRRELGFGQQEAAWKLDGKEPVPISEKALADQSSGPVRKTLDDVMQPKIWKLVVSYAKEDVRYVDCCVKKCLPGKQSTYGLIVI